MKCPTSDFRELTPALFNIMYSALTTNVADPIEKIENAFRKCDVTEVGNHEAWKGNPSFPVIVGALGSLKECIVPVQIN